MLSQEEAPPRPLIAIVSCQKYRERREASRRTWLRAVTPETYAFFLGGETAPVGEPCEPDCVYLGCGDSYQDLTFKVRAIARWALERGFSHLFKVDDDTWIDPWKLLRASGFESHDYVGWTRGRRYCHGGAGYWLSRRAMELIATDPEPAPDPAEDVYIGKLLQARGVVMEQDRRYLAGRPAAWMAIEPPKPSNAVITLHGLNPGEMLEFHRSYCG